MTLPELKALIADARSKGQTRLELRITEYQDTEHAPILGSSRSIKGFGTGVLIDVEDEDDGSVAYDYAFPIAPIEENIRKFERGEKIR